MKESAFADFQLSTLRICIADMIALGIRTRLSDAWNPPGLLYQSLPMDAMPLLATIPHGTFEVSIPQRIGRWRGFPISKALPQSSDAIIIVYARNDRGRYDAVSVKHQNAEFEMGSFVRIARQWTEDNVGKLTELPGHYACFEPSREEWDGIRQDNGYVAMDPKAIACPDSGKILAGQPPSPSGIRIRIPLFIGSQTLQSEFFPVFSQVEVAQDSDRERQDSWVAFAAHQKSREVQANWPHTALPEFFDWLALFTQESGFDYWIFSPGMLFEDKSEWWGDRCRRRTSHEGLDFAEGWRQGVGKCCIPEGSPVRSIMDGVVIAILDDFIDKTIVLRHASIAQSNGEVFHTFLSHIRPEEGLLGPVTRGQILGRVAKRTRTRAPVHLHVTGAWIPNALPVKEIGMNAIHPGFAPVVLVDFNKLLWESPLCRREE